MPSFLLREIVPRYHSTQCYTAGDGNYNRVIYYLGISIFIVLRVLPSCTKTPILKIKLTTFTGQPLFECVTVFPLLAYKDILNSHRKIVFNIKRFKNETIRKTQFRF